MSSQTPPNIPKQMQGVQEAAPVSPPASLRAPKPQRVLACVLCQQRKVKCDRKFPCANCTKARVQCVPATLGPRRRRRKFTDRALLDRLRKYEELLKSNNITFETHDIDLLHERGSNHDDSVDDSENEHMDTAGADSSTLSVASKYRGESAAKNIWHAMTHEFRDPGNESDSSHDDVRSTVIKRAWEQSLDDDDLLLFGTRRIAPDLLTFHPNLVHIFKLWQTFVDNVDPILKVLHTPSLQSRIIEAASDLTNIDPTLEALMFSIYCISILSFTEENCQSIFGSPKADLLLKYRAGCQQALSKAGFLRTRDRECLTALFLYLISIRMSTVSHSLSAMLGLAVRIAERIGMHDEASLAKCSVFEAEMRRRVWWALVLLDARQSETSDHRSTILNPSWDCRLPSNVNDSDLRPDMKEVPHVQQNFTDATFAVVRAELGEYIRHATFHLEFLNPHLKPLAKPTENAFSADGRGPTKFEQAMEAKYLKHYDSENPLQSVTMWTLRGHVAKYRLFEHHAKSLDSSFRRNDEHRATANFLALRMLECDAYNLASAHTRKYSWFNHLYFPFIAYMQMSQTLKRQPLGSDVKQEWEMLSDHYEAWNGLGFDQNNPFFKIFANLIFSAWDACEAASKNLEEAMETPRIVSLIRKKLAESAGPGIAGSVEQTALDLGTNIDELLMSMSTPTSLSDQSVPYTMGMTGDPAMLQSQMYPGMPAMHHFHAHMLHRQHWSALGGWPGWNSS